MHVDYSSDIEMMTPLLHDEESADPQGGSGPRTPSTVPHPGRNLSPMYVGLQSTEEDSEGPQSETVHSGDVFGPGRSNQPGENRDFYSVCAQHILILLGLGLTHRHSDG